eukprot:TRINITY_DN1721_c0_g1_i23.p1 TRINITY_DN1721_c0_g1~~TRINITY_DN1721_c0_g1_i23.p1  ORF type:complete len:135 (-),score=10.93 TRINITY_DN1721_c0_g1_i23:180-584(-)
MIRRPPRSTQSRSSAASDVYKRQSQPYVCTKEKAAPTRHRWKQSSWGHHQLGRQLRNRQSSDIAQKSQRNQVCARNVRISLLQEIVGINSQSAEKYKGNLDNQFNDLSRPTTNEAPRVKNLKYHTSSANIISWT